MLVRVTSSEEELDDSALEEEVGSDVPSLETGVLELVPSDVPWLDEEVEEETLSAEEALEDEDDEAAWQATTPNKRNDAAETRSNLRFFMFFLSENAFVLRVISFCFPTFSYEQKRVLKEK